MEAEGPGSEIDCLHTIITLLCTTYLEASCFKDCFIAACKIIGINNLIYAVAAKSNAFLTSLPGCPIRIPLCIALSLKFSFSLSTL